jgi:hypothetical protein
LPSVKCATCAEAERGADIVCPSSLENPAPTRRVRRNRDDGATYRAPACGALGGGGLRARRQPPHDRLLQAGRGAGSARRRACRAGSRAGVSASKSRVIRPCGAIPHTSLQDRGSVPGRAVASSLSFAHTTEPVRREWSWRRDAKRFASRLPSAAMNSSCSCND